MDASWHELPHDVIVKAFVDNVNGFIPQEVSNRLGNSMAIFE